ncbi:hypothetical protein HDU67_005035 [Dinochytrium kinnereticum]|nr:hypothetical protein HDU67_005035 [Dinochytrium kinnereticum]
MGRVDATARSVYSSRSSSSRGSQKGWRKTVNTYKIAFFNTICAMMKAETEEKPILTYLKVAIEGFQLLTFPFLGFKWGPIGEQLGSILLYTQVEKQLVDRTNATAHLALIGISMLLVTKAMALAFYTPDPQAKDSEARPLPAQDVFLILDKAVTALLADHVAEKNHIFFGLYLCFSATLFQIAYLIRLPLQEATAYVKNNDLEGQFQSEALMKRLKIRNPYDVTILVRFVWKDASQEDIELADSLYQSALQYFMDENQNKAKRTFSLGNNRDSRAFLLQQYGMFLMICKGDLTTSQLYFKRAQQLKPNIIIEFVTFEAEKDRKERVVAQERGGGIKMDVVDRVEYKQLLKMLAVGNASLASISTIFSKMERAEKDAMRYYQQLMAKFSNMPKILQQYSDFLDLTQEVKEAESVRMDLRELLEEQEDVLGQNTMRNDSEIMSQNGRTLSFAQYSQKRRGTLEKRALIAYGRIVTSVQEFQRRNLSTMIFMFCLLLFIIVTTEMIGTEILRLTVDQVHQSGNMSLWAIQMQLNAITGNTMPYTMLKPEVAKIVDFWEETREGLYFDNNLIDSSYTEQNTSYILFTGLDTAQPFIPLKLNILESARGFGMHAVDVLDQGLSFFTEFSQFPITVGNVTMSMKMPSAAIHRDMRMLVDNVPSFVFGYDSITEKLTEANEKEILITLIVFGALFGAWAITLLAMALFVFYPAIPQEICFEMYVKYRFEKAQNFEDAEGEEDNFSDTMSDEGDNTDSDDEEADSKKLVIYGASASRFKQITVAFLWALLYLLVLFTADVSGSAIWLRVTMADAGRRLQRSAQMPFFAQGFVHLSTELMIKDPISPINATFMKNVLELEISMFETHRYALMYGNYSLGLPPRKLTPTEQDFFFAPNYVNNTKSLDALSTQLINDVRRLLLMNATTPTDPAYLRLMESSPIVVRAFTNFANRIKADFNSFQFYLSIWSTRVFYPLIVFFIFFAYWKLFRKIMNMILYETQKTVRLLLLIPLQWVGKISDIKKVLDLDAHELDIPEIKALTGSAEEDKLNELIAKHLNPPQERSRSTSEPVQHPPNFFEFSPSSDEKAIPRSSTASKSLARTSATSRSSVSISTNRSRSTKSSHSERLAIKPKFSSLGQLNRIRLSSGNKVYPLETTSMSPSTPNLGVRKSIASEYQNASSPVTSPQPEPFKIRPSLKAQSPPPDVSSPNRLLTPIPKAVRGNSVSFGSESDSLRDSTTSASSSQSGGSSSVTSASDAFVMSGKKIESGKKKDKDTDEKLEMLKLNIYGADQTKHETVPPISRKSEIFETDNTKPLSDSPQEISARLSRVTPEDKKTH